MTRDLLGNGRYSLRRNRWVVGASMQRKKPEVEVGRYFTGNRLWRSNLLIFSSTEAGAIQGDNTQSASSFNPICTHHPYQR
jgi:hypothetical protein